MLCVLFTEFSVSQFSSSVTVDIIVLLVKLLFGLNEKGHVYLSPLGGPWFSCLLSIHVYDR